MMAIVLVARSSKTNYYYTCIFAVIVYEYKDASLITSVIRDVCHLVERRGSTNSRVIPSLLFCFPALGMVRLPMILKSFSVMCGSHCHDGWRGVRR